MKKYNTVDFKEFYKNKKVFVTGGAGLIGSFLVDSLVDCGADVVVLDNLYRGKKAHIQHFNKVKFLECDIINSDGYADELQESQIVFHAASKVLGIGYSAKNHIDMMLTNDNMTNAFFDALAPSKKIEQLVVVSSSSIYDDNGPDTISESYGFTGTPEKANLGYGLAKRFLEQKAEVLAENKNIKLSIFRPSNIYGERYSWAGENSQGLPSLVKKLLDGNSKIEIWGTGNQRRNYMHAFDCANIMLCAAAKQNKNNDVFNIGVKETISLRELVEIACNLYQINPELTFNTNMPEGRFIKSSDDEKLLSIIPNFKENLISIEDGLLRMQNWYHNIS